MWDDSDEPDLKEIQESAIKTINIKAEEYDNYNEFVEAKIKTISPALIILMTATPEDGKILNSVQALWLKEFWESRGLSAGMKN